MIPILRVTFKDHRGKVYTKLYEGLARMKAGVRARRSGWPVGYKPTVEKVELIANHPIDVTGGYTFDD